MKPLPPTITNTTNNHHTTPPNTIVHLLLNAHKKQTQPLDNATPDHLFSQE